MRSRTARTLPRSALEVRRSGIAGQGVYALGRIGRGVRIVEYVGERITVAEADRRYEDAIAQGIAVVLFQVDDDAVIDAGSGGNRARFINHSCEPNCESVLVEKRVFIRSLRAIEPGEELTYDYKLRHEEGDTREVRALYPCRCGAPSCRGTLMARGRGRRRR